MRFKSTIKIVEVNLGVNFNFTFLCLVMACLFYLGVLFAVKYVRCCGAEVFGAGLLYAFYAYKKIRNETSLKLNFSRRLYPSTIFHETTFYKLVCFLMKDKVILEVF